MTARLLDDNPAPDDLLGFARLADALHAVVTDAPTMPFTLGVFGEWGSGKTTLMEMLRRRLTDDGVKTVWFKAWKYDGKELIWNALIQQVFHAMVNDPDVAARRDGVDFTRRVEHMAKALGRYAAKVATRLVPGGILKEEDVDAVLDALSLDATDGLFDFVNRFEEEFGSLVHDYVGDGGRLVVFVDDLDRCLPENAVMVMEALKLYLDRADCIFVIGAESGIIEAGIRQRYDASSLLSAEEYLDKIIQLPFALPPLGEGAALALLEPSGEQTVFRDDTVRRMVLTGTGGNPRRVKRFANALLVLSSIVGDIPADDQMRLAKVLMLQMRFPALYRALVDDHGIVHGLTEALVGSRADLERAQDDAAPAIRVLYDDEELRRFLVETQEITMERHRTARWIRLTRETPLGEI